MKPLNTILTAKIISLTLTVPDQKWAVALSGRIFISAFRDKEKITCLTKKNCTAVRTTRVTAISYPIIKLYFDKHRSLISMFKKMMCAHVYMHMSM